MKKLTCHCGQIEIEVNLRDGLTNLKDVIAQFVKERVQFSKILIKRT